MTNSTLIIRMYGDPCLRKKAEPVEEVGPGERMIIRSMIKTMHKAKGVGLAAPQVGINRRFFVVDVGDGPMAIINPRITKKKGSGVLEEGCLSIPEVTVMIDRPYEITVEYMDENNRMMEMACDNLLARVIQHETDHLDGKLIVDYATPKEKEEFQGQLSILKAQQKE